MPDLKKVKIDDIIYDLGSANVWSGTNEEYEAVKDDIKIGTLICIEDDPHAIGDLDDFFNALNGSIDEGPSGISGRKNLEDLPNVYIQDIQDKHLLIYDAETQTWRNGENDGSKIHYGDAAAFEEIKESAKVGESFYVIDDEMSINVKTEDGWVAVADNGSDDVYLTRDEYDALGDEKYSDGVHYYITDYAEGEGGRAYIDSAPVGNIIAYMGNKPPQNYLVCDGKEYGIAKYFKLAEHIKNEFGSYNYFGGNGETTFAVPDLRGRMLVSSSDDLSVSDIGGEAEHVLTVREMAQHGHNITAWNANNTNYDATAFVNAKISTDTAPVTNGGRFGSGTVGWQSAAFKSAGGVDGIYGTGDRIGIASYAGNSEPHNNMPPYMTVLYCIKYTNTDTPLNTKKEDDVEIAENVFEHHEIINESIPCSLTSNTSNWLKTFTLEEEGYYLMVVFDNYQRNSNRSYMYIQGTDVFFFNSLSNGFIDIKSDVAGYSDFYHTVLVKATAPNATVKIGLWGSGYSPNSMTLRVHKLNFNGLVKGAIKTLDENRYMYSTDERVVGEWINGKKIYQKTFKKEGKLATGDTLIGTINNFDECCGIEHICMNSAKTNYSTYQSNASSSNININVNTSGDVKATVITDWSGPTLVVTVRYTKKE